MKKTYLNSFCARCLTLLVLALLSTNLAWGEDTYERLTSIANIDESAQYVLGIDGTGFHYEGTSSWGKTALPSAQTPLYYTLKKATDGKSFTAQTTIGKTTYYLQVPTSNTFGMATSTGTNTDLIIGTTLSNAGDGANYAVTNEGTTTRHIRRNGDSGLRSYASTTGAISFFYKVVKDEKTLTSIAISGTPNKTTYETGESFDPAGLVVTGTYTEGDPEEITSGITWEVTPSGALTVGTTSVKVKATVGEITSPEYEVTGLTVTAAIPKITITADQVTDFTNSYKEYTWTASDVSGKMFAYKNNGMQFNTDKGGYYVYNTDPIPGNIRSIKMTTHSNGTEREWKVSVGTTQINAISGDAGTEPTKKVEKAGTTWTITGSNQYFCLVDKSGASNISEIVISYEETAPDTREMPTASFENETVNAVVGDNFTKTVTTNSDGAVTYSSSDDDVAMVDQSTGEVLAISAGTATITATIAGTETYKPASASYTIVVASAPLTGKGTEAEPYTVGDIIALGSNGEECWVSGTIVGFGVSEQQPDKSYKLSYTTNTEELKESNFVISDGNGHIAAVELPSGSDIRTALNLPEHLNYIGAPIKVYGKLTNYFSQVGVKSTSNYKLTQQDVTISSAGWATACLQFNATISNNATAYYVTGTEGNALTKVKANVIPAGEGILLKSNDGEEATVTFTISDATATDATGNMMKGSLEGETFNAEGYKYYILAKDSKTGIGFYYQVENGTSADCAAGKAVLAIPEEVAGAKAGFPFDEKPTGIESIKSSTINHQSSIINLNGVRVNENYKGIIIVNGKKYINK